MKCDAHPEINDKLMVNWKIICFGCCLHVVVCFMLHFFSVRLFSSFTLIISIWFNGYVRELTNIFIYILLQRTTYTNTHSAKLQTSVHFYCIFVVIIVAELITRWICVVHFLFVFRCVWFVSLVNNIGCCSLLILVLLYDYRSGYKWSRSRSYMRNGAKKKPVCVPVRWAKRQPFFT